MAETSKARFTITLGRGGQVVKRAATAPHVDYSGSFSSVEPAGSKRSVRDRLGSNLGSSSSRDSQVSNKRQRGESCLTSLNATGVEDFNIGKDDLRLKLMQKNVFRRPQSDDAQKTTDLREKLSRTVQSPGPSYSRLYTRQSMPEPKDTGILGRIPPTRNAYELQQMESSRNSFSPWTLDHIRRRSPDRVMGVTRGFSPPRTTEELPQRPLSRAFDDARPVSYMNRDVLDTPRSVSSSTAFISKPVLPAAPAKPAAPLLGQLPPRSGILQKSPYVVEEQQTVEGLLHSLGLGKYAILFKAEEIDMTALKQMGESDLKELGIPMGPRKKIILSLLPPSRRQT